MTRKTARAEIEWQVEGDFFGACNCHFFCPCLFLADPDEGDCEQAYAWHIATGQYGATKLDGLNVVGIFYAPGNLVTGPRWKAVLYLDERADAQQAEALRQIFSGQAGGHPGNLAAFVGEWLGVRSAPIQFTASGKHRAVSIPTVLELEVEGVTGADPNRESCITNTALTVTPGFDSVLGRSTHYTYHDHNLRWDNSGRHGNYSHFVYTSK
jgi:hypothetical protein